MKNLSASNTATKPSEFDVTKLAVPITLGQYTLIRPVGHGGMGTVYVAQQQGLRRPVAVKVCAEASPTADAYRRFVREANTTSRLAHPNIVTAFDFGIDAGKAWFAMPLVDGKNLDSNEIGVDDWELLASIGEQISSALEHAHSAGVIHRDVKPANLILDQNRKAWITDFGIAAVLDEECQITQTGEVVGTPKYMAPEQLSGMSDERSDIYGLGVSLYKFALSLHYPAEEAHSILSDGIVSEFESLTKLIPGIPTQLSNTIMRACRRAPNERYQSAAALRKAFLNASLTAPNSDSFSKRWWLLGASVLLLGSILLGAVWLNADSNRTIVSDANLLVNDSAAWLPCHVRAANMDYWLLPNGDVKADERCRVEFANASKLFSRSFEPNIVSSISDLHARDDVIGDYAIGPYAIGSSRPPQNGQCTVSGAGHVTEFGWHFPSSAQPREFCIQYRTTLVDRYEDYSVLELQFYDDTTFEAFGRTTVSFHSFGASTVKDIEVWAFGAPSCEASVSRDGILRIIMDDVNLDAPYLLVLLPPDAFPQADQFAGKLATEEPYAPYICKDQSKVPIEERETYADAVLVFDGANLKK